MRLGSVHMYIYIYEATVPSPHPSCFSHPSRLPPPKHTYHPRIRLHLPPPSHRRVFFPLPFPTSSRPCSGMLPPIPGRLAQTVFGLLQKLLFGSVPHFQVWVL